jgi:2-polyprenyl-3-methyl-5-hydroxy-6-metoxy-1,4-benzoquinol methylase
MSRLREKLIEQYAAHYSRLNAEIDPTTLSGKAEGMMERTFGPALQGVPPGGRVLDAGCGTGFMLYWLSKRGGVTPVGVDSSPSQIEVLRRKLPRVEVHCADGLEFLKQHPEEFHVIFCTDVLEHIPGDGLLEWVEVARRALVPGGVFVCRTPNGAHLVASQTRYVDLTHERCFTETSLLQLLYAGGFDECRVLPMRMGHLTGRLRMAAEWLLHRAVYAVCGNTRERVYTHNIHATAVRRREATPGTVR